MLIMKAKVFVSCGQRSAEERRAASQVARVLADLGFEPYVATEEQTLKGLRENIFWNLETSEYFLFVDFKREQLAGLDQSRGSLFSNQELALASYLDLDVVAFRQSGVRAEDGLMRFLQANAVEFADPRELPQIVESRIRQVGWKPDWKNALRLEVCEPPFTDATDQNGVASRFFHLRVRNLHHRKPALMCTAYVERIAYVGKMIHGEGTGQPELRTVELRWAGSSQLFATIPPGLSREVDLGVVPHQSPNLFAFNTFSTSTQYMPPLGGPAKYNVEYVVSSITFPPQRFAATVRIGASLAEASVESA